jgi:hypothetical protein
VQSLTAVVSSLCARSGLTDVLLHFAPPVPLQQKLPINVVIASENRVESERTYLSLISGEELLVLEEQSTELLLCRALNGSEGLVHRSCVSNIQPPLLTTLPSPATPLTARSLLAASAKVGRRGSATLQSLKKLSSKEVSGNTELNISAPILTMAPKNRASPRTPRTPHSTDESTQTLTEITETEETGDDEYANL